MAMMAKNDTVIEILLCELDDAGINVSELKKLYERGHQVNALKDSLIKLYQARKLTK